MKTDTILIRIRRDQINRVRTIAAQVGQRPSAILARVLELGLAAIGETTDSRGTIPVGLLRKRIAEGRPIVSDSAREDTP